MNDPEKVRQSITVTAGAESCACPQLRPTFRDWGLAGAAINPDVITGATTVPRLTIGHALCSTVVGTFAGFDIAVVDHARTKTAVKMIRGGLCTVWHGELQAGHERQAGQLD